MQNFKKRLRGDCSLDIRTRGFLELVMDEYFRRVEIIKEEIEWVQREMPISSFEDVMRGYIIGGLHTVALTTILRLGKQFSDEDNKEIKEMLKRRLPEIIDKINRELGR